MKRFFSFGNIISFVFILCGIYWLYLVLFSRMAISCDAIGYEYMGSLISKSGWLEYFKTGPNREPFYPFVVSLAMDMARMFSVPYQYIQKIIQVLVLFLTQVIALFFLERLKINKIIRVFVILYMGFSPAIVNSAFSLYSEIVTYPFVLGIILASVASWRNVQKTDYFKICLSAPVFALLFALLTLAKGIYEYIFIVFLLPYLIVIISTLKNRNKHLLKRAILHVIISVVIFNSLLVSYKLMNLKYNGNFELTERQGGIFYSNAVKRSEKLTLRVFLAHLASIPGEGFARMFFTPEEVAYCTFFGADRLKTNFSNREYISRAPQYIFKRPFQYILFMAIEGTRTFFWETTNLGFVDYPPSLSRIFMFPPVKNGIRLAVSLLTIVSFAWLIRKIMKERKLIYDFDSGESESFQTLSFMALFIASHILFYSLVSVLTRFALPIAPLFILVIACFFNSFLRAKPGSESSGL